MKVNTLVIQSLVGKKADNSEAVKICQPESLENWGKSHRYKDRKTSVKACDVKLPETSTKG